MDDQDGLTAQMERGPELFLVAEEDSRIVGAVLGRFDGRRGWVNHLAVAPDRQGQGLGSALMKELDLRLQAAGCQKVNLLIEPTNVQVQGFYERLGYARDDLIFMEKLLPTDSYSQPR